MTMIEIATLGNGAHRNQTAHGSIPDGWAVIPDGMECENFPFGEVTTEEVNGVMVVASWTPGELPESEPEESTPEPTEADDTAAMLVDHEYRLTLLELGLSE